MTTTQVQPAMSVEEKEKSTSIPMMKKDEEYRNTVLPENFSNPATEVFERVAQKVQSRSLIQIIISLVLTFIFYGAFYLKSYFLPFRGIIHLQISVFFGFNMILYGLPLAVSGCIAWYFAAKKRQPMCSCHKLKRAYRLTLEDLPVEMRSVKDPYKSTPFLLKHLYRSRQYLFWSYMMISLILLALNLFDINFVPESLVSIHKTVFGDSVGLQYYAVVFIIIISSIILIWDKRMPNFTETSSGRNGGTFGFLIVFCLLGMVFFFFEDNDCCEELDKYEYEDL